MRVQANTKILCLNYLIGQQHGKPLRILNYRISQSINFGMFIKARLTVTHVRCIRQAIKFRFIGKKTRKKRNNRGDM